MFFVLSKLLWLIIAPLNLITLLFILAAILSVKWQCIGRKAIALIVGIFLFLGIFPIGHDALVALETTYQKPATLPPKVDGIIVLGGAIHTENSLAHGEVVVGQNGARIFAFLELARLYPDAKLIFTGGSGQLGSHRAKEADYAKTLLANTGMDVTRVIFEGSARNTYENAVNAKALANPIKGESWILITSAYHMPRSVNVFHAQEWDVIPWPVGYLTDGRYHYYPRNFDAISQYVFAGTALKEYIGNIVYRWTGKGTSLSAGDQ